MKHALNVAAFVNTDNMSLSLLGGDKDAVNRLYKLNLLRIVDEDMYSIHRLHQEAARKGASPSDAIEALGDVLTKCAIDGMKQCDMLRRMKPHIDTLRQFMTTKEHHSSLKSGNEFLAFANLLERMGDFFLCFDLSLLTMIYGAIHCYTESLAMKFLKYGTDGKNTDLTATLNKLGDFCFSRNECYADNKEEMTKYCQQGLEMCIDVYGEGVMNEDIADALLNVGRMQHCRGNFERGSKNHNNETAIRKHLPSSCQLSYAQLYKIAYIYCSKDAKMYEEAVDIFEQTCRWERELVANVDSPNDDATTHRRVSPCCSSFWRRLCHRENCSFSVNFAALLPHRMMQPIQSPPERKHTE